MSEFEIVGYGPGTKAVMEDMGVTSIDQVRPALLGKLASLHQTAQKGGNIRRFDNSPHEFIVCKSTDFYPTLVNAGHGNSAMTFIDRREGKAFFLLFEDKIPEAFYPMAVAHETAEYEAIAGGVEKDIAHSRGVKREISTAEESDKKEEYLAFLKEQYPGRYRELEEINLI